MTKTPPGFTRTLLSIAVPVTLQNLLASSFTLIDTMMIGRLGDTPLAAVGMAGKWTWFLTIVFFGFSSGASVFISQFYGAGDDAGMRRTYGLMTVGTQAASLLFMLAALLFPEGIVRLFSPDEQVVALGSSYLRIIAVSYPFLALTRGGGTLLQSTGRVMIPFVGSLISVAVNIVLNALLIFGLCGFPALGVQGAAIASLVSAVVGALVIYGAGVAKKTLLRTGRSGLVGITGGFIRDFARVSMPAMLNESAWALGNLLYSSVYGHMGTGAYASITVVKSIEDLTSVAVMGLCSSCAVMIGSAIGRGDVPLSKLCAKRHVQLTIGLSVLIGAGMLDRAGDLRAGDGAAQHPLHPGDGRVPRGRRHTLWPDRRLHHAVPDRPAADDASRSISALERADDLSGHVSLGGYHQVQRVSPAFPLL